MPARVEMAVGHEAPLWPLPDTKKRVASYGGLAFGARRASGARHHAGVDLLAPRGAVVVAPESGELVARQRFNGPNAHALLLQTDTGPVLLLGEVEPNSWHEFGLDVGSRVDAGMPVARVGINPGGSTMLHFETYRPGTTSNRQWAANRPPPRALLEPTQYLKDAAAGPVEVVPSDHPPDDPIEPDIEPVEPDAGCAPGTCPPGMYCDPEMSVCLEEPVVGPDPVEPLICPPGMANIQGKCVPKLIPPFDPLDPFPDPVGPASCPAGMHRGPDGNCVAPPGGDHVDPDPIPDIIWPPGLPGCPAGHRFDEDEGGCVPVEPVRPTDPIEPILPPVIPGATPPEPNGPPGLLLLALLAAVAS